MSVLLGYSDLVEVILEFEVIGIVPEVISPRPSQLSVICNLLSCGIVKSSWRLWHLGLIYLETSKLRGERVRELKVYCPVINLEPSVRPFEATRSRYLQVLLIL